MALRALTFAFARPSCFYIYENLYMSMMSHASLFLVVVDICLRCKWNVICWRGPCLARTTPQSYSRPTSSSVSESTGAVDDADIIIFIVNVKIQELSVITIVAGIFDTYIPAPNFVLFSYGIYRSKIGLFITQFYWCKRFCHFPDDVVGLHVRFFCLYQLINQIFIHK